MVSYRFEVSGRVGGVVGGDLSLKSRPAMIVDGGDPLLAILAVGNRHVRIADRSDG